jgi:NAD(P)-dependent dehydrogenase (short-subunit alcohol dehydrogenase family)
MHRPIAGLRTIVTGATSGIGRALAIELVRQGACVVAMGRREERLRELATTVAAADRFALLAGDVTKSADRAAAIDLCCSRFGGLDALVNNAGIGALGPFAEADEERLRRVMEVNLFAPAEFIREALPHLRAGRTPIVVNVGSVLGHRAVPDKSEYCASKFALHGLSDALRIELGREGIDVLLVSPSTTQSEFFDVAGEREASASRWNCDKPDAKDHRGAHAPRSPGPRSPSPCSPGSHRGMSAETVARRMVTAMRRGRREIILSVGGTTLVWLDRLCPPLADWIIARWG